MFKALDLTINSLGSGSVVGKKGKKRDQIFFPFPPMRSLVPGYTINDCNFIFCFAYFYFGGSASVQKRRFTSI